MTVPNVNTTSSQSERFLNPFMFNAYGIIKLMVSSLYMGGTPGLYLNFPL